MVAVANQTAGRSEGTSTGSLVGWMMEEELHQLLMSDLQLKNSICYLINEAIYIECNNVCLYLVSIKCNPLPRSSYF